MLIERNGNIWSYVGTHRIVIPTNTIGVMGAGLARQAKEKYPGVQDAYKAALASLHDKWVPTLLPNYPDLVLAPTKVHWREASSLAKVGLILVKLSHLGGGPYAIPEMGCGLGGLKWKDVEPYYSVFKYVDTEWVVLH